MGGKTASATRHPGRHRTRRPLPIHTDRLVVRCYQPGDGPAMFQAIDRERASILPWMVWATTDHRSVDDSIHYVETHRRALAQPGCREFPMGIYDKRTGDQIGGTGLHRVEPTVRDAEIGYWVVGSRARQGVCTEAIGALITQAFQPREEDGWGLRRVYVMNATANLASRRVCEKLGLRLEARLKHFRYLGGESGPGYYDVLLFAVLCDEWDYGRNRALPDIHWNSLHPKPYLEPARD